MGEMDKPRGNVALKVIGKEALFEPETTAGPELKTAPWTVNNAEVDWYASPLGATSATKEYVVDALPTALLAVMVYAVGVAICSITKP